MSDSIQTYHAKLAGWAFKCRRTDLPSEPTEVQLLPEPNNPYDKRAVLVMLPLSSEEAIKFLLSAGLDPDLEPKPKYRPVGYIPRTQTGIIHDAPKGSLFAVTLQDENLIIQVKGPEK